MLDIYKFHTSPDQLYGFEGIWARSPMTAVHKLLVDPDNKQALELVLSTDESIIRYVRSTGKVFPEGLSHIRGAASLVEYARITDKRLPKDMEQQLLVTATQYVLIDYAKHVIQGPWKELESKLAAGIQYFQNMYVYVVLDGEWSKFDNGQFKTRWVGFVTSALDDIIETINEESYAPDSREVSLDYQIRDGVIRIGNNRIELDGVSNIKCYAGDEIYCEIDLAGLSPMLLQVKLNQYVDEILLNDE